MSDRGSSPIRIAAFLGVFVALGVFSILAFISPDEGPTATSVRQGLALAVMFAAPPVATLITPQHAAAMGGAMFVAGAATMMGGNVVMSLMTGAGFLLLIAATTRSEQITKDVWIRFALVTIALVTSVYLVHGTATITGLVAVAIGVLVVVSGNWRSIKKTSRQELV